MGSGPVCAGSGGVSAQPATDRPKIRDERLDGRRGLLEDLQRGHHAKAVIAEMQHSVLGTRGVYDGLRDPKFVVMLAAVAMTGQGEALGMAVYEARW